LINRWNYLRADILSENSIKQKVNAYLEQQNIGGASTRTFERWVDSGHAGKDDREELRSIEYFSTWIDNRMEFLDGKFSSLSLPSNVVPIANAGVDQRVNAGTSVSLTAQSSFTFDENDSISTYSWEQVEGEAVVISNATTSQASFDAPAVDSNEVLKFKLTITDSNGKSSVDYVNVVILSSPKIVINEIFYNPPGGDEFEFIEIYNDEDYPVDITGWRFSDGIEHQFVTETIIESKGVLVLSKDNSHYPNSIKWDSGKLKNSGEDIVLVNDTGGQIDVVEYDDSGDWPEEADGDGYSLELKAEKRNATDNDNGASWVKSSLIGGSPGEL
jgi:hypothetical protein